MNTCVKTKGVLRHSMEKLIVAGKKSSTYTCGRRKTKYPPILCIRRFITAGYKILILDKVANLKLERNNTRQKQGEEV